MIKPSNVHPVSRVASSLARLMRQAATTREPIGISQKGRVVAVMLDTETFERWAAIVAEHGRTAADGPGALPFTPPWAEVEA